MDAWFKEIHVPRAWRVYLATGFDFREKNGAAFESTRTQLCCQPSTFALYYEGKMKRTIFPETSCKY